MLSEKFKYAYIDESGTFGYNFENDATSRYFIITAVIIDPDHQNEIKEILKMIQNKYFGGSEIKSSQIGNDYIKRIKILKEITNLEFDILTYVIDKRAINLTITPGMGFKKSFLKICHRYLHKELTLLYESLDVFSDEYGTKEFMDGFIDYFNSKELYLCSRYDFHFNNSKDNIFLQLADLICGTIAYKYEERLHKDKYKVFLRYLSNRTLRLEEWPIEYKRYLKDISFLDAGEYDEMISKHCIELATKFVNRNEQNISEKEIDQINIVKFLLFKLRYENVNQYYTGKVLRDYISRLSNRSYSNHQFKSLLVAKLRDNGVIISSSNKGYKIPISESELYSYTNHTMQVVYPMLERLRKCRNEIRVLTGNELDILDNENYVDIRDYFDYIKNDKL